jgi:hypothetical protein
MMLTSIAAACRTVCEARNRSWNEFGDLMYACWMKTPSISRLESLLVGLLLALTAAACTSDPPTAPSLPEGEVTPVGLYSAANSGLIMAERRVVRQQTELDKLWDDIFSDGSTPADMPVIDFTQTIVLAVAKGEQPESCHTIAITLATSDGSDLTVTVTETGPPTGCGCDPTKVQPVEVVSVPRADHVFFHEATVSACPD